MIEYGTNVVGGVTPGRAAQTSRAPCLNTVADAGRAPRERFRHFVPPPFAADAILEAAESEIPLVICITEGIPVLDMIRVSLAWTQ